MLLDDGAAATDDVDRFDEVKDWLSSAMLEDAPTLSAALKDDVSPDDMLEDEA